MMGSGKSTVGRMVARSLGRDFVDVDEEIELAEGVSVAELFAGRGEAAFRELEEGALARVLASSVDTVVSVGGGAVLSEANRRRLRGATVVWLRARPETLVARVGDGATRPLLAGRDEKGEPVGVAGRLAELDGRRAPLYREVAGTVLDVDDLSPGEVAERVVELCR